MLLSVVMPVFNEKDTIEEIIKRVQAVDIKKEIVIVDDGSTDGTRDILADIKKKYDNVRVYLQKVNRGKGSALKKGFSKVKGDVVIIQDADLEYDPEDYHDLIKPIQDGKADVVYGSRFLTGKAHRVLFFWHSLGNKFLTFLSNMFCDLNLTDMETCYKMFKAEVVKKLDLKEKRFGVEPEITAKISKMNLKIYEVSISYSGRDYSEGKKIGMGDGFSALRCILKYNIFG